MVILFLFHSCGQAVSRRKILKLMPCGHALKKKPESVGACSIGINGLPSLCSLYIMERREVMEWWMGGQSLPWQSHWESFPARIKQSLWICVTLPRAASLVHADTLWLGVLVNNSFSHARVRTSYEINLHSSLLLLCCSYPHPLLLTPPLASLLGWGWR